MLKPAEIAKLRTLVKGQDERLPEVFGALSDQHRCTMFRTLLKRERLCVSDIAGALGISLSLASQHLKILENNRLIVREKEGRTVYYSPAFADPLVRAIIRAVQ